MVRKRNKKTLEWNGWNHEALVVSLDEGPNEES